jgi:hypothetical protein
MRGGSPTRGRERRRRTTLRQVIALQRLVLFADYEQFYVQDVDAHDRAMRAGAAMDPDLLPGGWTDDAVQVHRIGLEPHSISVGTARNDLVETVLAIHTGPPHLTANAEHVVEADLDIPTGVVPIVGCTQPPQPEHGLTVVPGRYRARVSYVPSTPPAGSKPHVPGDYFSYQIDMWPFTEPTALTVIRQGPSPWAG